MINMLDNVKALCIRKEIEEFELTDSNSLGVSSRIFIEKWKRSNHYLKLVIVPVQEKAAFA